MEPPDFTVFPWHASVWSRRFAGPVLAQALLLVGAPGHGREVFARGLVRSRFCSHPTEEGRACGECQDCRWTSAAQHPDLHVIDPSQTSANDDAGYAPDDPQVERAAGRARRWIVPVDAIRHATDALRLSSAGRGLRILLIEHADTMNPAAANALLKVLEEPPPGASIVLSTGAPSRLPATVRSRCQTVRLPSATRDEALMWLRGVLPVPSDADERLTRTGGAPLTAREIEPDVVALQRMLDAACERLDTSAAALGTASAIPEDRIAEAIEHLHRRIALGLRGRFDHAVLHPDDAAAARKQLEADAALRRLRRLVDHPLNSRAFREELMLVMRAAETAFPGDSR
jgi:DNA polymerase III subunit delta'